MSNQYNLGRNNEFGSIDFSKIKGNIDKETFLEKFSGLGSVFDMFDVDKNNILSRGEINNLQAQLAGIDANLDGILTKRELSKLVDKEGKKIGSQLAETVMTFLSSIGQMSEEVVETIEEFEDGSQVITYTDGTVEEVLADGTRKFTSEINGIKTVTYYDSLGRLVEQSIQNGTTLTKESFNYDESGKILSTVTELYESDVLQNITTIEGDKTTVEDKISGTIVITEPAGDSNTKVTVQADGVTTVQLRDADYEIINEIIFEGNVRTCNVYAPRANGAMSQEIHNTRRTTTLDNGDIETIRVYRDPSGNIILEQSINNQKQLQYIRDVDGNEYGIYYDGNGNSKIVVQNEESPALIARRFRVDLNELLELNSDKLRGSGDNKYFEVGAEILIPREVRADEEVLQNRLTSEAAIASYERNAAIRAEQEQRDALIAEMTAQYEEISAIYEEKQATKARRREAATGIINNLYNGLDQNCGTGREYWAGIGAINADNVVEVLEGYPARGGESLFHAIDDESFINNEEEHYLKIFNCLVERARAAGVPESTISSFERDWFRHEAPATSADYKEYVQTGEDLGLDSSWFQNTNCQYWQDDPDEMNEICTAFCAAINGYELYLTSEDIASLQGENLTPAQMSALSSMFGGRIENADTLFRNQLASDGWCGRAADWFAEVLWNSDNIEELVGEDIEEARELLSQLQGACTSNSEILRRTFTNNNGVLVPAFNTICNEVLGREINWNSEADVQQLINFLNSPECEERHSSIYYKYLNIVQEADQTFKDKFKEIFDMDFDPAQFVAYTKIQQYYGSVERARMSLETWQRYKGDGFNQYNIFTSKDLLENFVRRVGAEASDEPLPLDYYEAQAELLRRGEEAIRNAARDYYNNNTSGNVRISNSADLSDWVVSDPRYMDPFVRSYLENYLDEKVEEKIEEYNAALGGNDYETIKNQYENAYSAVFGTKNDVLQRVLIYNESQEVGAGIIKGITTGAIAIGAGATAMWTGGSSVYTAVMIIGTMAPAVVELSDAMSTDRALQAKENGGWSAYLDATMDEYDIENTMKQVLMGALMMPIGMGVGQIVLSASLKSAVAQYATMVATDTLLGAGAEYAMNGEVTVGGTLFNVMFALVGNTLTLKSITPKKGNNTPDPFDSNPYNDGLHTTQAMREQAVHSMNDLVDSDASVTRVPVEEPRTIVLDPFGDAYRSLMGVVDDLTNWIRGGGNDSGMAPGYVVNEDGTVSMTGQPLDGVGASAMGGNRANAGWFGRIFGGTQETPPPPPQHQSFNKSSIEIPESQIYATTLRLGGENGVDLSLGLIESKLSGMQVGDCISIGRSFDCDVVVPLDFRNASRNHLVIEKTASGLKIHDCSSNGTIINPTNISSDVMTIDNIQYKPNYRFTEFNGQQYARIENPTSNEQLYYDASGNIVRRDHVYTDFDGMLAREVDIYQSDGRKVRYRIDSKNHITETNPYHDNSQDCIIQLPSYHSPSEFFPDIQPFNFRQGTYTLEGGLNRTLRLSNVDLDLSLLGSRLDEMQLGETLTVGRGSDNDVVIPESYTYVSSRHLTIEKTRNGIKITDHSTNGTIIDPDPSVSPVYKVTADDIPQRAVVVDEAEVFEAILVDDEPIVRVELADDAEVIVAHVADDEPPVRSVNDENVEVYLVSEDNMVEIYEPRGVSYSNPALDGYTTTSSKRISGYKALADEYIQQRINNKRNDLLYDLELQYGSRDKIPATALSKLEQDMIQYENSLHSRREHIEFMFSRPDLFHDCLINDSYWYQASSCSQKNAWKMHIFSNETTDWIQLTEVIMPYLKENGITFKTLNAGCSAEALPGNQNGKAFTIYPESNEQMAQIARDLDYIIRQNNLQLPNSNIVGDAPLGDSGRLYYRYEYTSKNFKDVVLDLSTDEGYARYRMLYDKNRGNGENSHLASDMTLEDDPWRNFDPSQP